MRAVLFMMCSFAAVTRAYIFFSFVKFLERAPRHGARHRLVELIEKSAKAFNIPLAGLPQHQYPGKYSPRSAIPPDMRHIPGSSPMKQVPRI
jgi:hypothetical protein